MNKEKPMAETVRREHPSEWKYASPGTPGFHAVITPDNSSCRETWAFRLNLPRGERYRLHDTNLEMNAGVVSGALRISHAGESRRIGKLDSFYLPAGDAAELEAEDDAVLFIGGARFEGEGEFLIRRYDPELPIGEIRQIHGEPPFERHVFMTLNQETPASRLICGFTWGNPGAWTSWPPHQHTVDLEEVYCYYDIPAPKFALHLASREPGKIEAVHPVSTGDFIAVPAGYHPTVGMPGIRSSYFWIMAAHRKKSRSYDLAKADGGFTD